MDEKKKEMLLKMREIIEKGVNITYDEFEKLFGELEHKVQYNILEHIEKRGIKVVEKKESEKDSEILTILENNFILEELERISNEKKINKEELNSTFDFLTEKEFFNLEKALDHLGYKIVDGKERFGDIKPVVYDEEQLQQMKKFTNEELIQLYRNGNTQMLNVLLLKNYRFIYYVIKKEKLDRNEFFEMDDLFQEGVLGLKIAIDRFNENEGNFTTYAYFWVRQHVERAVMNVGDLVRIPIHIQEKLTKIARFRRRYSSDDLVNKVCEEFDFSKGKAEKYIRLLENRYSTISLDKPVNEKGDLFLVDILVGDKPNDPHKLAEQVEISEAIQDALKNVCKNEKHIDIINKRYGLENEDPQTLAEIGKDMNLTRERIRQIQKKVEERLKRHLKKYKDYCF